MAEQTPAARRRTRRRAKTARDGAAPAPNAATTRPAAPDVPAAPPPAAPAAPGSPAAPPSPAAPSSPLAPAASPAAAGAPSPQGGRKPNNAGGAARRRRPSRDVAPERALRDLVGAGHSQVGVDGALRARDVNRPTEADLAEAEREIVIARRNWQPPPA